MLEGRLTPAFRLALLFLALGLVILYASSSPSQVKAAFGIFQLNKSAAVSSCPDSVPAPATSFGFTTCTFAFAPADLSRVDVNNSGTSTASTDFWVANPYQNFVAAAADISINNGALRVLKSGCTAALAGHTCFEGDNSPTLASIYCPYNVGGGVGCDSATSRGRSFKNGFYLRYTFTFDATISNGNTPFQSLWGANWPGIVSGTEYTEMDATDAIPGVAGTVGRLSIYHNWQHSGQATDTVTQMVDAGSGLTLDGVTFNTVDILWVPTTKNSGTGIFQTYINGTHITNYDLSYTQSGNATVGSGGISPANFAGAFYNAETNANGFAIFLSVGLIPPSTNWPLWIRNIQVWQTSTSDRVTVN